MKVGQMVPVSVGVAIGEPMSVGVAMGDVSPVGEGVGEVWPVGDGDGERVGEGVVVGEAEAVVSGWMVTVVDVARGVGEPTEVAGVETAVGEIMTCWADVGDNVRSRGGAPMGVSVDREMGLGEMI